MARMSDEAYELKQENREKKITAQSARNRRGHAGKGGAVKLPSDNLTKKQREAMNGKCEIYRLNSPMSWEEFNSMPTDLKVMYIKLIRDKYHTPDRIMAYCMGISAATFSKKMRELNIGLGRAAGAKTLQWYGSKDQIDFESWWFKTKTICGETRMETEHSFNLAVPNSGTLTFEGDADNIANSIKDILRNRYVRLNVQWTVTDAPDTAPIIMDTAGLAKAATVIDYAVLNAQRKATLGTEG